MSGRTDDYTETKRNSFVPHDENLDVSNWVNTRGEESAPEDLENPDVYENRSVGVKVPCPWRNKKCPSCKLGFNTRSNPEKCHGCDSYTHRKEACLKKCVQESQFYCEICVPSSVSEHRVELHSENYTQEAQGFKCSHCGLVAKTKYSVNRHIQRKHIGVVKPVLPIEENSIVTGVQKISNLQR